MRQAEFIAFGIGAPMFTVLAVAWLMRGGSDGGGVLMMIAWLLLVALPYGAGLLAAYQNRQLPASTADLMARAESRLVEAESRINNLASTGLSDMVDVVLANRSAEVVESEASELPDDPDDEEWWSE